MSDTRFTILGVGLIFVGFIIMGGFGHEYQSATLESDEFGTCYEYSDSSAPIEINCSYKVFDQSIFFGIVIGFIVVGVVALIKGVKGDWDNKVKPEDVVGPGSNNEGSNKD